MYPLYPQKREHATLTYMNRFILKAIFLTLLLLSTSSTKIFAMYPLKGVAGWNNIGSIPFDAVTVYNGLKTSWFYSWSIEQLNEYEKRSGLPYVTHFNAGSFTLTDTQLENKIRLALFDPEKPSTQRLGRYYLIGNEPDMASGDFADGYFASPDHNNNTINAKTLATQYYRAVSIIKRLDPSAKIIFGGLGRLYENPNASISMSEKLMNEWKILSGHDLKNDIVGWHVHFYGCCSWALATNPPHDLDFEDRIKKWKDWQNTNFPNTETWLTEYGIRVANPPPSITNHTPLESQLLYMRATTQFLIDNRNTNFRIDRFAWFPIVTGLAGYQGGLYTITANQTTITEYGILYRDSGNPPNFTNLQTFNNLTWYGNFPQEVTIAPLNKCQKISEYNSSKWNSLVVNFSKLPQKLTTLITYSLSCLP